MRKVCALLVGINDYPTVPKLHGCLNDVDNMHRWLKKSVGDGLAAEVLKDQDATRANVIGQFRKHLGSAQSGDAVFFHYCGHGAQTVAAPEFRKVEPDGLDEGLVLWDSRQGNGWDLADKELALLIGEVAQAGAEVVISLDACHSGSGTRDADEFNGLVARLADPRGDTRPLETYLDGEYVKRRRSGETLLPAPARHILLAACDRSQTAKESHANQRGIFTSALVEVLDDRSGQLSYRDLFLRSRAAVRSRANNQDPRFECIGGFDGWRGFLGGSAARAEPKHWVFFDKTKQLWRVSAGAADGLGDDPSRPVGLALYGASDDSQPVHQAHTTAIEVQESTIAFDTAAPAQDVRFQAAITSLPTPPLEVHVADAALRPVWQAALDGKGAALAASGALLTDATRGPRYRLAVEGQTLALASAVEGGEAHPVLPRRVRFDPAAPAEAAQAMKFALLAVVQWERLLALRNRRSLIDTGKIGFTCVESGAQPVDAPAPGIVTLESVKRNGEWQSIMADILVRNQGSQPLFAALLMLGDDFSITAWSTDAPLPQGSWFSPLLNDGLQLSLDHLDRNPPVESTVRFKLIVSASRIDEKLLEQEGLGEGSRGGTVVRRWRADDWQALDLSVRIVPRLGEVSRQAACSLADGHIVIREHARLSAQVRLAPTGAGTRGVGEGAPFLAAFSNAKLELARFGAGTRGVEDTPVLEISGIRNADQLATDPLQIELRQPLKSDESLLAFTYDGTHVLPCGRIEPLHDGIQLLSISHLPQAEADTRSLGSALKLYFFKSVLKKDSVNQLRRVKFLDAGGWEYADDDLRGKVKDAQRILLMVHGIIGDTEGMAGAARSLGLDSEFDLLLTYDYENLNTPIQDTARRLKEDLAKVELKAGQGRKITVLAHSMGGLVSRWFIEKEGGHELVEHLVMCGTPNRGSPFSTVDDVAHWLDFLKGLAANFMPEHLSPIAKIGKLLLEKLTLTHVTKTLGQMDSESRFIKELNSRPPDPGVRYTILAGNVHDYRAPASARFPELIDKLGKSHPFSLMFGQKPHDIAVARDSILHVSAQGKQPPTLVACHHLNYFVSDAGQQALKAVAWK